MNKVALITGSSSGIGKSMAILFASNGYDVIIHYNNNKEGAIKTKEECDKYNVKTLVLKADLSNCEEIKAMVDRSIKEMSKIDILINNASIAIDTLYEEKTKENFMKTLEVNLVGTFLLSKYVGDIMYNNKYGKIINITSTNGIDKYYPMCLDYDASKAGLISLTHNLALQYAPYICVNAIAPGFIATENELKDMDIEYQKLEEEKIFVRRIGRPDEVANLALFLASSKADYINNEVIRIDGGTY